MVIKKKKPKSKAPNVSEFIRKCREYVIKSNKKQDKRERDAKHRNK